MAQKQLPADFQEFIRLLNEHNVRYVLIGGWAVGLYAEPRFTTDIDFFVEQSPKNIRAIVDALASFGLSGVPEALFWSPNEVFRLGRKPLLIEILMTAKGIQFDTVWKARNTIKVQGVDVHVISKKDLIRSKKAAGRTKDLADLESLLAVKPAKRKKTKR